MKLAVVVIVGLAVTGATFWIERRPFRFIALAFVPFSFVWYYLERARYRRHPVPVSSR